MGDCLKESSSSSSVEATHGRWSSEGAQTRHTATRKQQRNKSYNTVKDKRGQFTNGGRGRYSSDRQRPVQDGYGRGRGGQGGGRGAEKQRASKDGVKGARDEHSLSALGEPLRPGDGRGKKSSPLSLNHLLNFTLAPRERQTGSSSVGILPFSARRKRTRGHSYNKEQFLQANCQFVVSAAGDYTVHSGDPDLLVEWDKIEQVRLFCHEIPSCPICLYPPRAAKITRCGHVYCWSCVLHYLSLGDKRWRKCPICYESIYKNDLKSVTALASQQYKVTNTITMKLMVREKGATEPCAKCEWRPSGSRGVTELTASPNGSQFVKLLSATPSQVLGLITASERSELEHQLSKLAADEASEQCFVESALEELKQREAALREAEVDSKTVEEITKGCSSGGGEVSTAKEATSPEQQCTAAATGGQTKNIWSSYADSYFEDDFQAGVFFSDSAEEEEVEERTEEPSLLKTTTTAAGPGDGRPHKPPSSDTPPPSNSSNSSSSSSSLDTSPSMSVVHSESSPELSPKRDNTHTDAISASHSSCSSRLVHFYQASDGQHLYLHPTNTRCLAKEYGGLENCPEEISASIVEMEQLSMSEEVRGRYRYLAHLPLTCEFVLCELELRPPLVSRETLDCFAGELQKRRQKRQKKKREEKRREKKVEPMAHSSAAVMAVPQRMSPETFHDYLSLASSPPLPSPTRDSQPGPTQPDAVEPSPSEGSSAPSFAQALQGKPPPVWPIKSAPKPHNKGGVPSLPGSSVQEEEEEEEPVPLFQDAFNEALVSVSALAAQKSAGGRPGSKTAKKGRKKIVLFSTGGTRGCS